MAIAYTPVDAQPCRFPPNPSRLGTHKKPKRKNQKQYNNPFQKVIITPVWGLLLAPFCLIITLVFFTLSVKTQEMCILGGGSQKVALEGHWVPNNNPIFVNLRARSWGNVPFGFYRNRFAIAQTQYLEVGKHIYPVVKNPYLCTSDVRNKLECWPGQEPPKPERMQ